MRQFILALLLLEFLFPHRLFAVSPSSTSRPPENRAWFENPLVDLVAPYDLNDVSLLSRHDVSVDKDPFFLRSQEWDSRSIATDENSEVSFQAFPGGVSISVHGINGTLSLHQPLVPVASTAEFLILASQDQKLFSQKTNSGEVDGEGLFAISFDELTSASVKEKKVPVYFLPMPGTGWVGQVSGIEVPEQELLVLRTIDGDALPLEISDIETMVKVGQGNLILSYALALRAQTRFRELGGTEPLPPTLSTAAFGLVFTGLHGENPGASLFPQQQSRFRSSSRQMLDLLGIFYQEGRALADPWMSFTEIFEQLLPKLTHVGTIVGVLTIGAIVLKYTLYRAKYVAEEQRFHPWREMYSREMEAWKHNLSIFGHSVNFLATAPYVFSGNPAQFLADRFFPRIASGANSLVRRMIKFFVGRATENNRNLALNDEVVKGALTKAGIDTLNTAYQLFFFVPHMLHVAADQFPDLKPRVDQILSKSGGEAAATFALEETAYVGVNHLTSGATEYASVAAANALQRAAVEVDEEMRLEPKQPHWEEERARRIEVRKKLKLEEAGLGKPDEFLFDAQTVFTSLVSMFGYAPEGAWKNQRPEGESRETYSGEERFGLILPSLSKALETANSLLAEYPQDTEIRQAVELLTSLNTEARYFSQYVRHPWNIWKQLKEGKGFLGRLREVRRQLLKLTYSGAVWESEVKNLPESWQQGRSPGAARLAAMCFQNAFFAFKEGSPALNDRAGSDHPLFRKSPGDAVKRQYHSVAAHQLQFLYPQEYDELFAEMKSPEECSQELRRRHPVQHQLILARVVNVAYDKKIAEEKTYEDPVTGWFAKWQTKRARQQALRAFTKTTGRKYSPNADEADQKLWQRLHAEKMMKQMGMIPIYDEKAAPGLQQAVETMASSRFNEFLRSSQVQTFVASTPNGADFLDRMRAIFTAHAYLDVTTQTNLVSATSPAQPGFLQRLRNCKMVRSLPNVFAIATRFVEAATHADGHHLGLANWFRRNVPIFTDLKEGLLRTFQLSMIYLSVVWMWNYAFWHIEMPWYMHASSFLIGYPLVVGPQLFLQRAFKNIGWKPTETFRRRAIYAFVYSWATFLGYPLTQYFEPEAKHLVESASAFFLPQEAQAAELPPPPASCATEISNRH